MSNISAKVNLRQLKHKVVEKDGKRYIVLAVESNHLFVGEKGIYLDLQGFEIKNKQDDSKDTHIVKQSLPKDVYSKMTDEQKKATPILGNMILWGGGSHSEPDPVDDGSLPDDLPF
jgi:hypothetical protein